MEAKIEISRICCISCGILFYIEEDFEGRLRKSHDSFYCPKGHTQYYPSKTKEELLKEEVSQKRNRIFELEEELKKKCKKKSKKSS